jgi:hypothetical protein
MAKVFIDGNNLNIEFSAREKRLLGRPSIKLQTSRIKSSSFETDFKNRDLGTRVSRRPLFAGLMGEYRAHQAKIIVLGNPRKSRSFLKLSLSHPTIDEIWYFGADAEAVFNSLKK